jgi:hypothetical protein
MSPFSALEAVTRFAWILHFDQDKPSIALRFDIKHVARLDSGGFSGLRRDYQLPSGIHGRSHDKRLMYENQKVSFALEAASSTSLKAVHLAKNLPFIHSPIRVDIFTLSRHAQPTTRTPWVRSHYLL